MQRKYVTITGSGVNTTQIIGMEMVFLENILKDYYDLKIVKI